MSRSQHTILYVEDDMLSREVMQVLIGQVLGHKLMIIDDNRDFLDKVRKLPTLPEVVFLDIQMYPHDGYEMLKMLRTEDAYKERPIIAMTASVMATDVDGLRKAGFDGLIGKPIQRRIFPDLLQQILDGESIWFVS